MKRLLSKTVVIAVVSVLFSTFGATPASAASAGTAVLTGTVTPDPVTAKADCVVNTMDPECSFGVSVGMTGTAAGVVNNAAATCAITYNSVGTTNIGQGSGTSNLTCNGSFVGGGAFSAGCNGVNYTQTGGVVVVTGSCTGDAPGSLTAACTIQVVTTTIAAECVFAII